MTPEPPHPLSPSRQIAFHQLLVAARKSVLIDALSAALAETDPATVKEQVIQYVPEDAQRILAAAGIRDEHVFPVPAVLQVKPTLIGYYRLLLGVSQKRFYRAGTEMGPFKAMEGRGIINPRRRPPLERFAEIMAGQLADLVRQIPQISARDIDELPLLTLGAQLYGSNNNAIGQKAIADVFLSVAEIVKNFITAKDASKITITNASGRKVVIAQAADPDLRIQEEFDGSLRLKVAVEIKGGTDNSNAHNRAGEAEKSHQKARRAGFRDFWTIISKTGVNQQQLQEESPTTNSWFDVAQVLAREGADWQEFKSRFADAAGIPVS
jgi:hypothetical protein